VQFKELAPVWDLIFKQWNRLHTEERAQMKHNMRLNTRCILGEVYGWTDNYSIETDHLYCYECSWIAFSFLYTINSNKFTLDTTLLEQKKSELVEHFKTKHINLIKK
jgi:hypothetical protein